MTYLPTQWRPTTHDADTFGLDGFRWLVASEHSHSFRSTDGNTFRMEVRKGDQFSRSNYTDPQGLERSEMGETTQHAVSGEGQHFATTYKFMIEPGAKNTASWMVIGQLHDNNPRTPPFEITMVGERMQIVAKHGSSNPVKQVLWTDSQDIVRGKWYDMKIDLQLGPNGDGHAQVWRDGQEIVDYAGKIGYTDSSAVRWKMGIYRNSPPGGETIAAQYKDVDLSYGSAAHSETSGTTLGSTITSVQSSERPTSARSIPDTDDRDVLTGSSSNDAFVFDSAPSSSNVDVIVGFDAAEDYIHLNGSVFNRLAHGELSSGAFVLGDRALDIDDRIIYNAKTGALSYDVDGSGSRIATKFVEIANLAKLAAADFIVI
jgi:Ca2+-binding RTX toxin-like protein